MIAVTIKEARVHLNALVERALQGEDVVLLRGSRHVASIVPLDAGDLEIRPRLTDARAERLWREIAEQRKAGRLRSFPSARAAVADLRRTTARDGRR